MHLIIEMIKFIQDRTKPICLKKECKTHKAKNSIDSIKTEEYIYSNSSDSDVSSLMYSKEQQLANYIKNTSHYEYYDYDDDYDHSYQGRKSESGSIHYQPFIEQQQRQKKEQTQNNNNMFDEEKNSSSSSGSIHDQPYIKQQPHNNHKSINPLSLCLSSSSSSSSGSSHSQPYIKQQQQKKEKIQNKYNNDMFDEEKNSSSSSSELIHYQPQKQVQTQNNYKISDEFDITYNKNDIKFVNVSSVCKVRG